jgi:hypothetical protein
MTVTPRGVQNSAYGLLGPALRTPGVVSGLALLSRRSKARLDQ